MAGERTLPGLGLYGYWTESSSGWKPQMDTNWRLLSAVTQLSVASRTAALPGSPSNGYVTIVPTSDPTNGGKVAIRDLGAWVYLTPAEGWRAWVVDVEQMWVFTGGAWAREGQPYDVTAHCVDEPTASQVLLRYVFPRAVTFADEFAGSRGSAATAATASTTFQVRKNGANSGTVVFAAAGTTATFTTSGTGVLSFAAGDVLEIVAPASPDATLADIAITLAGTR